MRPLFRYQKFRSVYEYSELIITIDETPMGFFRPFVSLSFYVNHLLFGAEPMGYALTNVVLVIAIAAAFVRLAEGFGFGRGPALFGAALWMFNMHGIGMSLTWISGPGMWPMA